MKTIHIGLLACIVSSTAFAQTVYVPSGTSGIGSSSNANVGVGTSAPADQFEVVSGNRKVGINGSIAGVATGGLLTLTRPADGGKVLFLGSTPNTSNNDIVLFTQSGNSELRLISGGLNSQGFGFYLNMDGPTAFASARPTPVMKLDGLGNLGIGVSAPGSKLHVAGQGSTSIDMIVNGRLRTGDGNNNGGIYLNQSASLLVGQYNTTSMGFFNAGSWRMIIDNTGNVGIGTTTTIDAKLAVKGQVHAQDVKVDLVGSVAPDYVFDKKYELPSLANVKAYIDAHHHLPEVPSAKEMETNGIILGEMNMLLLKKVEELTLYMIEMKEENAALRKEVAEIKSQIKK